MTTSTKEPNKERSLILFGLDERKQPRAARFKRKDEAVVSRMAMDLGLRIAIPTTPDQISVASKLCTGDINVTHRDELPDISWTLYRQLNDLAGGDIGVICPAKPKHWDHVGPSHIVVAADGIRGGWWPAFVLKRQARWLHLNWRDFPGEGIFYRHIHAVARLTATTILAGPGSGEGRYRK